MQVLFYDGTAGGSADLQVPEALLTTQSAD
jgi:hypothetical protein